MKRYLPVALDLEGKRVLLIGGGGVATERLPDLLDAGARLTVITPEASAAIRTAAERGQITWERRRFEPGDTEGFFLVLVATDDPQANVAAYEEAEAAGRLVNVCDDPDHCNLIFASRIQRGPLTISIFTHGTSPALSKRVRIELEERVGPEWGELAQLMADLRPRVMAMTGLTQPERQRIFEAVLNSEALELFATGQPEAARELAERLLKQP